MFAPIPIPNCKYIFIFNIRKSILKKNIILSLFLTKLQYLHNVLGMEDCNVNVSNKINQLGKNYFIIYLFACYLT